MRIWVFISGLPFLLFSMLLTANLLSVYHVRGQDSVKIKVHIGCPDKQMQDVMSFQGIEQCQLDIMGRALNGKGVRIYFEEYKNGIIVEKGALTKGLPDQLVQAQADTFHLKLLCQTLDSTQVCFYYPRFVTKNFFKSYGDPRDYSMRCVLLYDRNNESRISVNGEKQPVFTLSLPYEKEGESGYKYYCKLTSDGVPPSKWWDVYHVKHYVIFYLQIG